VKALNNADLQLTHKRKELGSIIVTISRVKLTRSLHQE